MRLVCAEMDSRHVDISRRHYVSVAHGKSNASIMLPCSYFLPARRVA